MNKLIYKLKSKTAKDSFLVLISNVFSQFLNFIVVVILGRFFSVAEYGVYSVLNNISSFVSDMADMGMNGAITRFTAEAHGKGEKKNEELLIIYSIKRKIISLIIVFVFLTIFAKTIAKHWLHDPYLYRYIYIVIVTCGLTLFVSALNAVLQGRQEFKKYFISIVTANIIWCFSIVIMTLFDHVTIFSSIISQVLSGTVNLFVCWHFVKLSITKSKIREPLDYEIKRKFNSFGFWMLLWAIFAILQSRLDIFMLASLTTPEQVSYYDIASKVLRPVMVFISAYSVVLNPQLVTLDKLQLKSKVKKISLFISFETIVIIIAIFIVKPIIMLVFGSKYINSIVPAQLLLFAIIFYVWTVPFNGALYALNKPYFFTLTAFLGLIVTAIGNYFLLGEYGAIGASITFIAAQLFGFLISICACLIILNRKNE